MKYLIKLVAFISVSVVFLSSCVTTNYYTAQTLEDGETVITPGVDNLILIQKNGEVVEKQLGFGVSLGVATGLPWRFETGIRGYFPYIYEANIRHQLNPKSFDLFDISANFHSGILIGNKFKDITNPYMKYGLTISKEISSFQPYLSYYLVRDFRIQDIIFENDSYSIICFGVAIPFKTDLIFPECNYYIFDSAWEGFFSIGVGVRVSLDSPYLKKK